MSSWLSRIVALVFAGADRRPAGPTAPPERTSLRPATTADGRAAAPSSRRGADRPEPVESILPDLRAAFFEWLLGIVPHPGPLTALEQRLLRHLDTVAAADAARTDLLPRAPAVIPQLMSSLRDANQSIDALAERVARDPNLVAEVIRLANAALTRGREPIGGLPEAISRVGIQGLKRAIAKVVVKPVFDAPADSLSGRAVARLWEHSEATAAECMNLAGAAGLDPFDGYLAGLLHNIGWSATLRALDRYPGNRPAGYSEAFVHALEARRAVYFALLAMPWQLTDAVTALAVELLDQPLADARSPLATALQAADRHAAYEVMGAGALVEAMTD